MNVWSADRFYRLAARTLLVATALTTSALALLSPQSLTARAADGSGLVGNALAAAMLLLAAFAAADVIAHDLFGRLLLPRVGYRLRHSVCVLTYAAIAGLYLVFAFVAVDPKTHTSWILIADYIAVAFGAGALTFGIAMEDRAL